MAAAASGPFPPLAYPVACRRKASSSRMAVTVSTGRCRHPRRMVQARSQMAEREPRCPEVMDPANDEEGDCVLSGNRREFLLMPLLAIGGAWLASRPALAAATGEPALAESSSTPAASTAGAESDPKKEDVIISRVYDATVIGEPLALGKDKSQIWEKLMNARVVYLGEAEHVPVHDDKDLELEIVRNLRNRCFEQKRSISLALEAFPCNLQGKLKEYMNKRIDGESLKSFVSHWPPDRWLEYEPLLNYCRDNGVRLVACGMPLEAAAMAGDNLVRSLLEKMLQSASSAYLCISERTFETEFNAQLNPEEPFTGEALFESICSADFGS